MAAALPLLRQAGVVFSDGEHLGIPLALVMRALGIPTPHLVIGHRPVTSAKKALVRTLGAGRRIDRLLVHARAQVEPVRDDLRLPAQAVRVVPYGVDTDFWSTATGAGDDADGTLVVAAGREHRDYECLAQACSGEPLRVVISGGSAHSPGARRREPSTWPANVESHYFQPLQLRELYRQAAVVVVPLLPCDFPAGITVALEAMAMGKAVVVSGTAALRGVIEDGLTGLVVPPGDPVRLRAAIRHLVGRPAERQRLGKMARFAVVQQYGLDTYVDRLANHLYDLAGTAERSAGSVRGMEPAEV